MVGLSGEPDSDSVSNGWKSLAISSITYEFLGLSSMSGLIAIGFALLKGFSGGRKDKADVGAIGLLSDFTL